MNFAKLASAHRLKEPLREAVRLVLVDGLTQYASSQKTGVDQAQLSRKLKKIRCGLCPHCGRPLPV